jgi:hypothetical protein
LIEPVPCLTRDSWIPASAGMEPLLTKRESSAYFFYESRRVLAENYIHCKPVRYISSEGSFIVQIFPSSKNFYPLLHGLKSVFSLLSAGRKQPLFVNNWCGLIVKVSNNAFAQFHPEKNN